MKRGHSSVNGTVRDKRGVRNAECGVDANRCGMGVKRPQPFHIPHATLRTCVAAPRRGFSLVEILGVIVIIALLAALIIPRIHGWVRQAQEAEALSNLGAIRRAELLAHQLFGRFVDAPDHPAIQSALDLVVGGGFYRYLVINATEEDFLALAIPLWPYSEWLKPVSIGKDGFVSGVPLGGRPPRGDSGGDSGGGDDGGGGRDGGGGDSSGSGFGGVGTGGGAAGPTSKIDIISLPVETIVDGIMPVPTNLHLTPNDGWIVVSWDDVGTGYRVYRATSSDGENPDSPFSLLPQFGTIESPTLRWLSDDWPDSVHNGQEYCYYVTGVVRQGGKLIESRPSEAECTNGTTASVDAKPPGAGSTYAEQASGAVNTLNTSTSAILNVDGVTNGDQLEDYLRATNTPILFAPLSGGTNAALNPVVDTITINSKWFDAPPQMLAALIAHETTHAIWDDDWETGTLALGKQPDGSNRVNSNSIDQEYQAFLSNAFVWRELRGAAVAAIDGLGNDAGAIANRDGQLAIVMEADGTLVNENVAKDYLKTNYYPTLEFY